METQHKRVDLYESHDDFRNNMLGLGSNKIKRRLNKLVKDGNIEAKLVRIALEIEDKNVLAKKTSFYYKDRIYDQKHELINELIDLFDEHNLIYGYQDSDIPKMNHIIYFEIPDCEQISWHCDLGNVDDIPKYEKDWDGKVNSTFGKLENKIKKDFSSILTDKKTKDK